jgi:hypothetical protein
MSITYVSVLVDLVAIGVVVSVYFHRHQRRDLMLAYVALNGGVFAVTSMLASAPVSAGLGLGLFGILSIIRLRSDSITQEEIAYYFIALALGLVTGLHPGSAYEVGALSGLLVAVMFVADSPVLFPRARHLLLTIDSAVADEDELRRHVEERLAVEVRKLLVQQLDFVRDITIVDVRCRRSRTPRVAPAHLLIPNQPIAGPDSSERLVSAAGANGSEHLVSAGGANGTEHLLSAGGANGTEHLLSAGGANGSEHLLSGAGANGSEHLVTAGGANGTRLHADTVDAFPSSSAANEPAQM